MNAKKKTSVSSYRWHRELPTQHHRITFLEAKSLDVYEKIRSLIVEVSILRQENEQLQKRITKIEDTCNTNR